MRLLLLLTFVLSPTLVQAQMLAPAPDAAAAVANTVLQGRWSGMVLCGNRGWAVIHDVTESGGMATSHYQFVGSSRGDATVSILPSGPDSFVLDATESNVFDYDVRLVDGQLVGTGRGEDCIVRLARFPETP